MCDTTQCRTVTPNLVALSYNRPSWHLCTRVRDQRLSRQQSLSTMGLNFGCSGVHALRLLVAPGVSSCYGTVRHPASEATSAPSPC